MSAPAPVRLPCSTYRLQLNGNFTFLDAAGTIPYLAGLGVTECYCSPILRSRKGSAHGYDVVDHSLLDPELGGDAGFDVLVEALRRHDMGLLVDFVPNHMSTDPAANAWWRSVLENGPSSPYAKYFDIDWDPAYNELKQKLLLPILGDQYGATLDSGALRLELADSGLVLRYGELDFPLNPRPLRFLLAHDLDTLTNDMPAGAPELAEFESILFHLEHLPVYTETDPRPMADRQREKEVAAARLMALLSRSPRIRTHVEDNVRRFNGQPGDSSSFDLLHRLLEAQPYRLASWRTAVHEINYRRFFDINELAGLRVEDPEVFAAMHERIGGLVRDGAVTGIRLDHVDGLYDPAAYFRDLDSLFSGARPYVVVEKILSRGETLDRDWHVHGTSGYDFLNQVNGLFLDESNIGRLRREYQRFTGDQSSYGDVSYQARRLIIATSMASELNVLAYELNRISESDRHWRDFTLDSIQEALREVVACFPSYRTYVTRAGRAPCDEQFVDAAIGEALRRNPALEPTIFGFIRQLLLPSREGASGAEFERRLHFAMKVQQFTGPVQAKGVEDTAFYRYAPLLSVNEVGGDPTSTGVTGAAFHEQNLARLRDWPLAMLTTSTHDTKRGEDGRARLDVLTEMPDRWRAMLARWERLNTVFHRRSAGGPDAIDEYLYYQTLVGAWPAPHRFVPDAGFTRRIGDFMRKAMREAKRHTSWINPSEAYEDDVRHFVDGTLLDKASAPFRRSIASFAHEVGYLGMLNSLSQLVLKICAPGVADCYQGAELWDLDLVDPDNRRPVDFGRRSRMIAALAPLLEGTLPPDEHLTAVGELARKWTDGRIKLFITAAGLRLRRGAPGLFLHGDYVPLRASGKHAGHVVSFVRQQGPACVMVAAPRLVARLCRGSRRLPVGAVWEDTALEWPDGLPAAGWRNIFTGETMTLDAASRTLPMAGALPTLPVGVWVNGVPPNITSGDRQ